MSEWQPIDKLPEEGEVLIWSDNSMEVRDVNFVDKDAYKAWMKLPEPPRKKHQYCHEGNFEYLEQGRLVCKTFNKEGTQYYLYTPYCPFCGGKHE